MQALSKYNLRELTGPNNPNRQKLSKVEFRRLTALKDLASDLAQRVGFQDAWGRGHGALGCQGRARPQLQMGTVWTTSGLCMQC